MTVYEVKSVHGEPKEWSGQYGPMLTYKLDLQSDEGFAGGVELNRKPESRAPQAGERVAGHLEEGKYADKLKIDFEETKALKQGGSEAPSAGTSSGARNDDVGARIERMAVIKALGSKLSQTDALTNDQKRHVEELETFISQASQASGATRSEVAGTSPPSTSPAPEKTPDDTHQWLTKLLEDAGLDSTGAHAIAGFIVAKFSPDQVRRAETGLKDIETQQDTLSKLRIAYEKATGEVVPVPSDDPEIPF